MRYTHSLGVLPLREAIADHYQSTYGVKVSPEQILVTPGTSPAILLLFGALLDPRDEVVLSDPYYACYPNFIRYAEGVPVTVDTTEEDGFQYPRADTQPGGPSTRRRRTASSTGQGRSRRGWADAPGRSSSTRRPTRPGRCWRPIA